MTAVLPPEHASAGSEYALRIVPIQANLLPTEVIDGRRDRRIRRVMILGLAIVIVLLAAWYGQASYDTTAAHGRLATAQDEAQNLTEQQKTYSDLVTTQAKIHAISNQLSTLLADDLQWSKLLTSLQAAAPNGIKITGASGALKNLSFQGSSGDTGTALPNGSSNKTIGTLTITGTGSSASVIASYADALGGVTGLAAPILSSTILDNGQLHFTVKLDITSAALGGRFSTTPSASAGTGS